MYMYMYMYMYMHMHMYMYMYMHMYMYISISGQPLCTPLVSHLSYSPPPPIHRCAVRPFLQTAAF